MFGKCCCCLIADDKFSANDGRPHAGWTSHGAGIWGTAAVDRAENSGGTFNFSKPDTQIFDTANPEGVANQHVQVKFTPHELAAASGVDLEVIVGYADETHYLVASVNRRLFAVTGDPCWYLELRQRIATVAIYDDLIIPHETRIGASVPLKGMVYDQQYILDVCLLVNNYGTYGTGDTVRAKVTTVAGAYIGGAQGFVDGYTTGAKAGLGLAYTNWGDPASGGNTLYGTVKFDDFKFTYFRGTSHLSCPNCNGPCEIFSDTFSYSDYELGSATDCPECADCFWRLPESPATGSGRITGGVLELDDGTLLRCMCPHPTNKSAKIVTVDVKWEAGIVAVVNLGSGYAAFDSTNRRIFLYDNGGTLLDSTDLNSLPAHDAAMHSVEVCLDGTALIATWDQNGTPVCADGITTDTGDPFVYLGSNGGTVHFNNFSFSKHHDGNEPVDAGCAGCNCDAECIACSGNAPGVFKVVFSGFSNGAAACAGDYVCSLINGTWYLELQDNAAGGQGCAAYVVNNPNVCCMWGSNQDPSGRLVMGEVCPDEPFSRQAVVMLFVYTNHILIHIEIFTPSGIDNIDFRHDFGAAVSCMTLLDQAIEFESSNGITCDTSGVTATASAIL